MELTDGILHAAAILADGGVVVFPTETVYGVGAVATDADAVRRIFEMKGRPRNRALIVHVGSAAAIDDYAIDAPDYALALAAAFWPGPLSLVLRARSDVSGLDEVTGGGDTVAVRVPDHPVALALLRALEERVGTRVGIAAPSANRFGETPATTAEEVEERLGPAGAPNGPDFILDGGPCPMRVPSTILRCVGPVPQILRRGSTPVEAIERVAGRFVDR